MFLTTNSWVTNAIRLFSAASSFWPWASLPSTRGRSLRSALTWNFNWLGLNAIESPPVQAAPHVGHLGLEAGQEPCRLIVHDGAVVDAGLEHVQAHVVVLADGADHLAAQLTLFGLGEPGEDVDLQVLHEGAHGAAALLVEHVANELHQYTTSWK